MTEEVKNTFALVFTGQGSQKPGMGADFFEGYPESAEIFNRASEALELDMQQLCFSENDQVNLTEFTQPAILTVEIAILAALRREYSIEPAYFGGHSLGEYTALVAAGVIPFEDALRIVRKRGALMQQAVPEGVGAMAALIGAEVSSDALLEIVTSSGAEVANFNSSEQVVISGKAQAVKDAVSKIEVAYPSLKAVFLQVSAPFHSTLMSAIEPEFESFIRGFEKNFSLEKSGQVLSNFLGGFHDPNTLVENLVRQISGSVKWVDNMKALGALTSNIVEVGPNRVLNRFFSSVDMTIKSVFNVRSMEKAFQ